MVTVFPQCNMCEHTLLQQLEMMMLEEKLYLAQQHDKSQETKAVCVTA